MHIGKDSSVIEIHISVPAIRYYVVYPAHKIVVGGIALKLLVYGLKPEEVGWWLCGCGKDLPLPFEAFCTVNRGKGGFLQDVKNSPDMRGGS